MTPWQIWTLGIVAALVILGVTYVAFIRSWHMRWGSTDDEVTRPLPGDDLVKHAKALATHTVAINATAAEVWPWLVQMGQGRGGFYSYDWLENLFGCDIHNANAVVPEWQSLAVGDGIKLHPKAPALTVAIVEPGRAIVLAGGSEIQTDLPRDTSFLKLDTFKAYTWAFVLDEQPDGNTRFLARVRGDWDDTPLMFVRNRLFMEPAHSIMQRKMNLGLKQRVEAARQAAQKAAAPVQ